MRARRAPRVLLVCAGLDHARRGFESFARECFETLREEPQVYIELIKGSGAAGPRERSVWTLRRDRAAALGLGGLLRVRPFRIEALAFAFALQPVIAQRRPDVIYLSEWDTARALARLRSIRGQRFKLLLCNGTLASESFEHLDHVQELTPAARDHVIARGADPGRHSVLPLGLRIPRELRVLSAAERSALRARLGLPPDAMIVITVAALNRSEKRLDYVIEEVAALPAPRPFLLLVGESDAETGALQSLASRLLGRDGHEFRTVAQSAVDDLLRASDVFVLASLVEAQGRAAIEAMSVGLPCVTHDSPVMRFALGDQAMFADLTQRGCLTALLQQHRAVSPDVRDVRAAHRHLYNRFSWECLRPRYVELLTRVAAGQAYDGGAANSTVSSSSGEYVSR